MLGLFTKSPVRAVHVCALVLLFCAAALAAQDNEPRVEIQIEPNDSVGLNELAILRIKIEGSHGRPSPVARFDVDNFQVVSGPSHSTSLTIVNGVPSSSVTLSWHLQALEVGQARVHSGQLLIGDQKISLADQQVAVVEEAPRRRRNRSNDPFDRFNNDPFFSDNRLQDLLGRQRPNRRRRQTRPSAPEIFLSAEVYPQNPYVGQQVLYTLHLFTQVDVRSVNPSEMPSFKGFWSQVIPQPEQLRPDMVQRNGQQFGKVVLLERALFARRSGTFEIEPAEARIAALVPDSGPFGSLLPRTKEITRQSNKVEINVRELPSAPEGFQGAVGQLSLESNLTPQALEVGEAATLTITLQGKGHFQGMAAPPLPELPGIRVFPPQQQSEEGLRGKKVTGNRSWSFVLVPEKPGEWLLPTIEMPYFDPQMGQYRTAKTPSYNLSVRGSTSLVQETGQTADLHPIRTAALPMVEGSGSLLSSPRAPWFFGLPWGLALLLIWSRNRRSGSTGGGARKVFLKDLDSVKSIERPRQAAAQIEQAWRTFLEERWSIPPGSPSPRWGQLLTEQGAPAQAAEQLVKLADDLHYLRYAPKLSSTAELQSELVERSRKLIKSLS